MAKYFKDTSTIETFLGCLGTIALLVIVLLLYAAIGMWLWNALMVPLFSMPVLGYWQTYGLMILGRMFFGGRTSSSSSSN